MSSLKELRNRVDNVKNMQRITAAMKMVAAAKLRKAYDNREWAKPYADNMEQIFTALSHHPESVGPKPLLMRKAENSKKRLVLVISSDRGLCGGFNANLMRQVREEIGRAEREKESLKIISVGRKVTALLTRYYHRLIHRSYEDIATPLPGYETAAEINATMMDLFAEQEIYQASLIHNRFVSNLVQSVVVRPLLPVVPLADFAPESVKQAEQENKNFALEPDYENIIANLAGKITVARVYNALLESFQAEQASRMNAMDNASRNANDLISSLTLSYNRLRQAAITKELVEIISGAEAV